MIIGPYVGLAALGTAIPVGRHSSFVRTDMTFSNPLQYAVVLIVTCTAQCIIMATSPCHIEVQIMHNTLCGRLTLRVGTISDFLVCLDIFLVNMGIFYEFLSRLRQPAGNLYS